MCVCKGDNNAGVVALSGYMQGMRLTVAHSTVAIGNVGELLKGISMVAHRASGNKIGNIMIVREFIIFCVIKHNFGSPITVGNLIW